MRPKVLMVSFAPKHTSALNRIGDCLGGSFDLDVYDSATDKVNESIASRILSLKFPKLMLTLLRSDASVFWAWGLDACILVTLAALLRPRVRLIWDITDINPRLLADNWNARLLRRFEWTLLRRADLLFLSSEAFYEHYYAGHIDAGRVKVIENLLPGAAAGTLPAPPADLPCVIVYSGIFRSLTVLGVLRQVAEQMQGDVVFHLHGYPDRTIAEPAFQAMVSGSSWVRYLGRYGPDELPELYARAHLSWAFVDPEANDNEKWLLTNRIYNALAFGRPALANSGIHLGAVVEKRGYGATCLLQADKITALIRGLMADGWAAYAELRRKIPPAQGAYLAGHYRKEIEALLAGMPS